MVQVGIGRPDFRQPPRAGLAAGREQSVVPLFQAEVLPHGRQIKHNDADPSTRSRCAVRTMREDLPIWRAVST
jgi:hypothetical protein